MARANLGALLGNIDDPAAAAKPSTLVETAPEPPAKTPQPEPREAPKVVAPEPASKPLTAAAPVETAPYLRLVRKETRLREDQQNQLTLEARRLNRAKATGTARITDNTLIRIAVDLLLARINGARGDDETAILESLKS